MTDLVLVYPSYSQIIGSSKYKRFGLYAGLGKIPERPHVGLAYLSEYLLQNNFDHEVLDMNLMDNYSVFKKRLKKLKPKVIGLTMVTPGYLRAYKLIKKIRKDFPKTKIVVGGPHVSFKAEKILKECKQIDVGFISESEQSLLAFMRSDCKPEKINGVVYRKNKKIVFNPPVLVDDISIFSFPKYEKFELDKYSEPSLYTSRGCIFRCVFCTVEAYRRKAFRPRSVESIIAEIKYWYAKGQRVFAIEDDNFTIDAQRIFDLCEKIEKLNYSDLQFALGQGVRADQTDRKMLQRMYDVGFKYATIAVEGGNNKILKNLRKGQSIEIIEETIKNACEIGYEVRLLFVIGAKDEAWEDIEDSFAIARKYPVMYSRFNNLFPIPGTELYDWVVRENLLLSPPEKYLNSYNMDYTEAWYETPEFSAEERHRALVESDNINQELFFKYLLKKFWFLPFLRFPLAYLGSRKLLQYFISENPVIFELALLVRRKLS